MRLICVCMFHGKCYWQSVKRTPEKQEYKVCRMISKFPNETCNQVKIVGKISEVKK